MLNALFIVGLVLIVVVVLVFWKRMNLRYANAEEDRANEDARYVGPVRLAVKRSESQPFLSIGNGINAIFLVVGDHTLQLKLHGVAGRVLSSTILGLGSSIWEAAAVTMKLETVDWNSEPFNRPHYSVVLGVTVKRGARQLSILPLDDDFDRLRSALVAAGVRT